MDIPPAKRLHQPNSSLLVVLPYELIIEILSLLRVKSLMRFKSMSKSWNTLISDPIFVKTHLERSARNTHLTLLCEDSDDCVVAHNYDDDCCSEILLVSIPLCRLIENPSNIVANDIHFSDLKMNDYWVVGSSNGLVCIVGNSETKWFQQYWFWIWNPATKTRSEKLGVFHDIKIPLFKVFKFSFGYDNSTGDYKVVAFRVDGDDDEDTSWRSEVKILSLRDNFWRKIQSFLVVPLNCLDPQFSDLGNNDGVHLSGTINWLALRNNCISSYYWKNITHVEQFVIVSLDLSTETFTQLLLPLGFDEVPRIQPNLHVLTDCLCFSHDFKGTEFIIWQMKEFGNRASWTQLLKVSYQNLQMHDLQIHNLQMDGIFDYFEYDRCLMPLCLSENNHTLILANNEESDHAIIIYNWIDNRVVRIRITNKIRWFSAMDYIESLVSVKVDGSGHFNGLAIYWIT